MVCTKDNINYYTKYNIKLFIIIILSCIFIFVPCLENDCFWLIKTGEHIISKGFPSTDPLTYHSGLYYSVQQWLVTIIFYFLHKWIGFNGLYILTLLFNIFLSIAIFNLCNLLSNDNKLISLTITLITSSIMSFVFSVPRPQIFSYLIFILEITMLEKYIKTSKYKYLIFLALLSIALINIHASLWIFFFLLFIPYLFDGINMVTNVFGLESHNKNEFLAITLIVCFLCGFINPYGLDNMFYSINSFGTGSNFIDEMLAPNFNNIYGIIYFFYIGLLFIVYKFTNSKTTLRFALITLGTIFMSLLSIRSFALLTLCSGPLCAYYLKDIANADNNNNNLDFFISNKLLIAIFLITIVKFAYTLSNPYLEIIDKRFIPDNAINYLVQNVDINNMKLYNGFDTGGYLEFKGIKPFIDSRAEVFMKSINKNQDILIDEINLCSLKVHYQDIFDKYGFTHWLINKNFRLNTYMSRDNNFEQIYEDEQYVIYKKAG